MGFACGALALAAFPADPEEFVTPQRAPAVAPIVTSSREVPSDWPAAFGVIPEVAPEPEITQEPEVVELPPEENTTYWLTGVVTGAGVSSWAMISENDRGVVVRVGDTLVGGETVTDIDAQGVWIEYEGVRELIPVQKTDFGTMVSLETPAALGAATDILSEVTVRVESAQREYVLGLFASAGQLRATDRQGIAGLEITVVRPGELFQQMGLQVGDTIVSLNGHAATSPDVLAELPGFELPDIPLEIEVFRAGTPQIVRVTFDQS